MIYMGLLVVTSCSCTCYAQHSLQSTKKKDLDKGPHKAATFQHPFRKYILLRLFLCCFELSHLVKWVMKTSLLLGELRVTAIEQQSFFLSFESWTCATMIVFDCSSRSCLFTAILVPARRVVPSEVPKPPSWRPSFVEVGSKLKSIGREQMVVVDAIFVLFMGSF